MMKSEVVWMNKVNKKGVKIRVGVRERISDSVERKSLIYFVQMELIKILQLT